MKVVCNYKLIIFFTIADDEESTVHGILTKDNLFDGTITTKFDNYYIEPAHRYSDSLGKNGIHTIVYKTSDVKMTPYLKSSKKLSSPKGEPSLDVENEEHYCASERLRKKIKNEFKRRRKDIDEIRNKDVSDNSSNKLLKSRYKWRSKRWLPDEVSVLFIAYHQKLYSIS